MKPDSQQGSMLDSIRWHGHGSGQGGHIARPDGVLMAALAALSALLNITGLVISGYANTYYAMAGQAASQSWSAWFFGALDAGGFITLDKPPLATMLLGLSVRVFGLSSWSVLLPQALLGIATVLVLFLVVRRSFGSRAAALAGMLMAVAPVAVLIFRFDDPDALLTFLLVAAAWALIRGLEHGQIRWAMLAAALVGAGFLTKFLQAWVILPVFAVVWLVAAPGTARRRLAGLLAAGVTTLVASGWWVAIVELIPKADRPYIGGSQTNSVLELLLGYDGLGRIFGGRPLGGPLGRGAGVDVPLGGFPGAGGPGPGGLPGGGLAFGGDPGLFRMFNDQFGGQAGWLLPAAILAAVVMLALVVVERRARTDPVVGGTILWVGWMAVDLGVFSFASGIIHPYYTVILAPALAAATGAAAVSLWDRRDRYRVAGPLLALAVVLTGAIAWGLLRRNDFAPGLGVVALAMGAMCGFGFSLPSRLLPPPVLSGLAALGLVVILAGPAAYDASTIGVGHAGGDPLAGPQIGNANPPSLLGVDAKLVSFLEAGRGSTRWIAAVDGSNLAAGLQLATGAPVMSMGGFNGLDPTPTVDELRSRVAAGQLRFVIEGGHGPDLVVGPEHPDRSAWLHASCRIATVSGSTSGAVLYDCAAPPQAG